MNTKQDVLLELGVFCLAIIAATTLTRIDLSGAVGLLGVLAFLVAVLTAITTACLAGYECATLLFDRWTAPIDTAE